ncbi:MAG: sigma-70 family RNA polymerase sigma factor [Spongiibacteraceae bacterium]|nr:sigma-70 family RNA polymerase sigma factor [Spongiibacteraceae bacterium]
MHQAEEDLLLLAAQDGNQKAFHMIYQKYQKPLLRYAFKICNDRGLSQDAAQEAWLKLARNIRKIHDPRALRSWLYKLVHWSSIDLMRKANRCQENEAIFEEERYTSTNEINLSDPDKLKLAINRLPSTEKQIVHLFYLDELTINEIAIVLRIPGGTVKSRLNRARKLLKQRFNYTDT